MNVVSKVPFSIIGLGTIVVDHQVWLKMLPKPDTKAEVLSDAFQVGGPVPTALTLLSGLGVRASFIGKWSRDDCGKMIDANLDRSGVGRECSIVSSTVRSGFAHVWVEAGTGRRSIAAYRGSHALEPGDLTGVEWTDFQALHLDGWSTEAAIVAAGQMKAAGGRVFLDLGSPKPHLESLVRVTDWLNCPLHLLERLYPGESLEKAGNRLIEMGVAEVTVTHGDAGAWLIGAKGVTHQPAFSIDAVDTNGAGDVFSGAMIYGIMSGWAPEQRLRFASAAAALKCCGLGNREVLPTLERIESFLSEKF
ncbi:MAG: PfkB family carbohydrate kinase [Verrucomicrobiota bacterium]|nr:PfkB family carbohydrate kinase [Verrucomicrobiota bacterium]